MDFIYYDNAKSKRSLMYVNSTEIPISEKDIIIQDFENIISSDGECQKGGFDSMIKRHHSSAFVDIDGDCINDLLIHSQKDSEQFLEIWIAIKNKSGIIKYCLKEIQKIQENFGLFGISDVNNDGQLDIVFPIKYSQPPSIFVAYNKKKVNYDWTKNYCEVQQNVKKDIKEKLFDEFNQNYITNVNLIF